MLGLNAGLLGPDVAIILITLVAPLTLFQFPLSLGSNEPGEIGVQLTLLVDAPFLDTVPALLLSNAKGTRNIIPKVESLLLGQTIGSLQIGNGLIITLHL